jgi:hypothetical protein
MKRSRWSRVFRVENSRAAAVFADPKSRRILMGFAPRSRSIGEAAATFNVNLKTLHYHVRKLVRLGLLVEVGSRRRGGRPIKLYRTVSKAFYISGEIAPKLFGDDLSRELRECLERRSSRTDSGIVFAASSGGSPRARAVLGEPRTVAAAEMWRVLRLSKTEAISLQQDLLAVLNEYQREAGKKGGDVYLAHAALAYRADQSGLADNDGGP